MELIVDLFCFLTICKQYNPDLLSLLILKVIICTDGKANTDLGNLEVEDNDARTLLSSTIFYQDLGEYAANQGCVHAPSSMQRAFNYCPARVAVVGLCSVIKFFLRCPLFISVTVSVLSIEGTDCRLDELGRLADRTGGKVRDYF